MSLEVIINHKVLYSPTVNTVLKNGVFGRVTRILYTHENQNGNSILQTTVITLYIAGSRIH